jgi:hypothetical protein
MIRVGRAAGRVVAVSVAFVALMIAMACACSFVVDTHALSGTTSDSGDASVDAVDDVADAPLDPGDALGEVDAGEPNLGISCGPIYCQPEAQACCRGRCSAFTRCIGPDSGTFACPPQTGENCGWNVFRCDDTADCNLGGGSANVCCGIARDSTCLRLGDCRLQAHVIYCDPLGASPCPEGAACVVPDGGKRATCSGL